MAQTKRRKRKHRGTQTGKIDSRPRGRPRNRAEAKARAQSRGSKSKTKSRSGPQQRGLAPPTWRSAFLKGLAAAVLFFVAIGLVFKRPVGASAALAAFMLVFYVPMSYYTDGFFYRRRMRQAEQEKLAKARRGGHD